MKETNFRNHVAIVTGASSGIGRALSLQLAADGASVALASRNLARLEKLAAECRALGGQAAAVPTDVSRQDQCQQLVEETVRQFGHIDMLVNNAGLSQVGKFDELPDLELFHYVMDVNFHGVAHCTYYALPYLKQSRGRIVNVVSLGGRLAVPYNTSYIASKFALAGFSDALRMDLSRDGVSVTAIFPYWVVTEFHERYLDKDGQPKGPSGRAIYTDQMMTAGQCANIILKAARQRKREVVMRPGTILCWLRLVAPNFLDRLIIERFVKPMVKRIQPEPT